MQRDYFLALASHVAVACGRIRLLSDARRALDGARAENAALASRIDAMDRVFGDLLRLLDGDAARIGLDTLQRLVDRHGGRIHTRDDGANGSSFTLAPA